MLVFYVVAAMQITCSVIDCSLDENCTNMQCAMTTNVISGTEDSRILKLK